MAENEIEFETSKNGKVSVFVDNKKLDPEKSIKVWNHADEFNVGYGGSGPAQAALAILLEFTDEETAVKLHQDFKWKWISKASGNSKIIMDVKAWTERHR